MASYILWISFAKNNIVKSYYDIVILLILVTGRLSLFSYPSTGLFQYEVVPGREALSLRISRIMGPVAFAL